MKEFTNAEKRTWEEQSLYTRVDNLDSDELPTANIVLAGITGTGKSTLINAIFGSKLAKTCIKKACHDEAIRKSIYCIPHKKRIISRILCAGCSLEC